MNLQQGLEFEEYNQETFHLMEELVNDWLQLSPIDKARKLNTLLFRCRYMDALSLEVVKDSLAAQKLIGKSAFKAKLRELKEIEDPTDKGKKPEKRPIVEDIEPWETPVKGHELLDTLYSVIGTHVVLNHPALVVCALWCVLTYCYDSFRILPMLAVTSPEKRCGKTTLLEILGGLANKTLLASNITSSAIFRTIEKYRPCLLIDETDTFINDNDELRGILNSGHTRKSAFVIRTNLETLEPEQFSTWAPRALSMIGALPDTLNDRSIAIRMGRKTVSENVKKMSLDFDDEQLALRRMCKRWAADNAKSLESITPEVPQTGNDRATDNWLPLVCIADRTGRKWPEKVRKAMLDIEEMSDGETIKQILLNDIREVFETCEKISSRELVGRLVENEDHPWSDWRRGKALTQNGVARLLKPFEIVPKTIRVGDITAKGYDKWQFTDAFNRYLSPTSPVQSVTMSQTAPVKDLWDFQSVTQEDDVTVANWRKSMLVTDCDIVTVQKGEIEENYRKKDMQSIISVEEILG